MDKKRKKPRTAMKLLIVAVISITLFGMFVAVADEKSETAPPKVGDTAPDWTLQDAEEKEHALKKLRGKVVFLIMGNRKIREEDDKWAEAFQKEYGENERVVAYIIGDLRSVPGFIPKRFIRSQLKKNPPAVKFLLDWKGEVHKQYQTEEKKPTLYLISQKGTIVFHRKSDFKADTYAELKKAIDKLLATPDAK
ncbi:redoxin domain-containing protein [Candidatus Poribacteria bacterium]|nr:redoxin domain-containing protein [Candidatus Poribacteria bacterium]